jgi:cytidylate kinase
MSPPRVVAVDGPAAAGKGTLARRLAAELGLPYLDTGLLYRAVGRRVLDAGGDPRDAVAAERAARALAAADLARPDLRGPEADMAASAVATLPAVRAALLDWQRDFGRTHGAVMDGRDIGTVIFPDAPAKLFVTASPEAELAARGVIRDLADVEAEMRARDAQDAARATAPMKPAADAVVLDTTELGIEEAFQAARALVRARLG